MEKRFYWIKLKESFITSDSVDFLMSQKNGANYVVLYQMLCLKTINTNGEFARQIGEIIIPYDILCILYIILCYLSIRPYWFSTFAT